LAKPENVDILPELAYAYEEPFADAGNLVAYMISRLARKYVTVALNGDGADEEFAGYPNRYLRLKRDVDFAGWINTVRPTAYLGLSAISGITRGKLGLRQKKFLQKSLLPLYRRFASYNQIFAQEELPKILKGPLAQRDYKTKPYEIVDECFREFKGKDSKDAGLKFDLLYWLPDDLLAKVDIASMASSLEARSPFLDHNMIELSCKIPFDLKVKNGETKYILKKALSKVVPKDNLYRSKMGFGVPLRDWFAGELNSYAEKVLLSSRAGVKEFVDQDNIKVMLKTHSAKLDFGPRLWALLALELWLREFFN
jgi:asparagine synthase (glutamine-hydrolysing)